MEAVCKPRMCIDSGFCGKYEGRDIKWGVRKSRKKNICIGIYIHSAEQGG